MNDLGDDTCQSTTLKESSRPVFLRKFLSDVLWRILNRIGKAPMYYFPGSGQSVYDVSHQLKPGEKVQVKPLHQIRETLNDNGNLNGLTFIPEMRNYCGQDHIVFKRVEKIIIESSGQLRQIKNTVLLRNVFCSGKMYYGCDRSCFFFWKEAWLKRTERK